MAVAIESVLFDNDFANIGWHSSLASLCPFYRLRPSFQGNPKTLRYLCAVRLHPCEVPHKRSNRFVVVQNPRIWKIYFFQCFKKERIRSKRVWHFFPLKNQNSLFFRVSNCCYSILLLKQTKWRVTRILQLFRWSSAIDSLWNLKTSTKNGQLVSEDPPSAVPRIPWWYLQWEFSHQHTYLD